MIGNYRRQLLTCHRLWAAGSRNWLIDDRLIGMLPQLFAFHLTYCWQLSPSLPACALIYCCHLARHQLSRWPSQCRRRQSDAAARRILTSGYLAVTPATAAVASSPTTWLWFRLKRAHFHHIFIKFNICRVLFYSLFFWFFDTTLLPTSLITLLGLLFEEFHLFKPAFDASYHRFYYLSSTCTTAEWVSDWGKGRELVNLTRHLPGTSLLRPSLIARSALFNITSPTDSGTRLHAFMDLLSLLGQISYQPSRILIIIIVTLPPRHKSGPIISVVRLLLLHRSKNGIVCAS